MDQAPSMSIADLHVLPDLVAYNHLTYGTYTSLIYESGNVTRAYTNTELAQESVQLGKSLQALGLAKGDRIIVTMPNCPEVVTSYQAIPRAGGVIIPIMPLLKAPEVHYIAKNSQARAIITVPLLLPMIQEAVKELPFVQHVIVVDTDTAIPAQVTGHFHIHSYSELVARNSPANTEHVENLPDIELTPDDLALIIYTSGTTGNPKGVALTHFNIISNATGSHTATIQQPEPQRHLAILPLAHVYGLLALSIGYLNGALSVMHPRFDVTNVLSAIERHRITGFAGVPAMFTALLNAPNADKYDTSSLTSCVSGSAPLPLAVLEGFEKRFHCSILEGYGLSEASSALTAHTLQIERKAGSVGKPITGVELLIVDENEQPLPSKTVGEVIARGPNIMREYYQMTEETQQTLRNGWLHTGDMGYLDEDGYLFIVERKKDLIIRGGFNIYPRDVEEVLNRHPAVIESAVVGIPSELMGEEVKAFVVAREEIDAEALKAYCRAMLANYKTPSEIEFLDALPRNPVGKINKRELRKNYVH